MSFFDRSAFIISNPESIPEIFQDKPPIFHIYLIGQFKLKHPNVTVYEDSSLHNTAIVISQDILERHLVNIFCDERTKPLKDKVNEVFTNNRRFAMGGAILNALENLWHNLAFVSNSYSVGNAHNMFQGKPAILVASGPSLDKNIQLLKELQNKAVIISCGSALGPLTKRGIMPHFEVVVDPLPSMYEVLKPNINSKSYFVMSLMAQYRISQACDSPKMYCLVNYDPKVLEDICNYTQIDTILPATASVATTAFSFALHLGADPIIFIGQDMCFSDSETHVDGIEKVNSDCSLETQDGRLVKSNMALKEVFDYFSDLVPTIKDRRIINATEGGAGIRGAEHITLEEAVSRYLTTDIVFPEMPIHKVDSQKLKSRLKEIRSNFSAIYVKTVGFKQKITGLTEQTKDYSRVSEKILTWFKSIRIMPGYEYLAEYLDWIWYQADTIPVFQEKLNLILSTEQAFKEQIGLIEETLNTLN